MKVMVRRPRRRVGALVVSLALSACGTGPTDPATVLPDGAYVVVTDDVRVVDDFATPLWMREMPTIEFSKEGASFVVTASSDDLVVVGPVQLAVEEDGFWRVRFGWAPNEEDHYWEILMTANECAAFAVDADLGIPPTGALTVVLEACSIEAR